MSSITLVPHTLKIFQQFQKDSFEFKPKNQENVTKIIDKFNPKKATGADKISVKLLKITKTTLAEPITDLINTSIKTCTFPNGAKRAQVAPLFKKDNAMTKSNYRPVSLLPIPSKIFEKVLSNQLSEYFDNIFDDFLCAFRKGHGCQTTLIRLLEDWKCALDNKEYVAAILMDLSKAFDCLPHNILLCKLSSYGLSENATKLMESYLSGRKQQIKIGNVVSSWAEIQKAAKVRKELIECGCKNVCRPPCKCVSHIALQLRGNLLSIDTHTYEFR